MKNVKLRELKGYKSADSYQILKSNPRSTDPSKWKKPSAHFEDFLSHAAEFGWSSASGHFGSVLVNPGKDYVYKIFYDDDVAYRRYVEWVHRNSRNDFVPKIGKVIRVPGTDDIFLVKIEKLEPVTNVNDPRFDRYINLDNGNPRFDQYIDPEYNGNPQDHDKITMALESLFRFDKEFNEIVSFAMEVGELDIHYENVMWRGKDLIVTDPVA
jgi:hypothetical protein